MPSQPDRIGRYPVVGLLAVGGMAEVWLCRRVGVAGFERPVVVKRVLPHLARQKRFVDMFMDEARIVAGLRHPNVVDVHELGHDEDLYLVMEYLEGESAAALMRRLRARQMRLPLHLAAYIVAESCAGLHEAHELEGPDCLPLGLVHRDVSPHNVFITYRGEVKVIDFGIAVAAGRLAEKTETGTLKGKLGYMAPEQCIGEPLDRRTDTFALGTVLFELATGRRLFKRSTEILTLAAVCTEPVVLPSQVLPEFPEDLESIVDRAVRRAPVERYQTAGAMRRDLLAFIRARPLDEEPREALEAVMRSIFSERIEEKEELISRVKAGVTLTSMPCVEVDEDVQLPNAAASSTAKEAASSVSRPVALAAEARPSRVLWPWIAVPTAVVVTAIILLMRSPPGPIPVAASPSLPPPPATSAGVMPTATVSPAASTIRLEVETTPPGARVLVPGVASGTTPVTLPVPRSDAAVAVIVELDGHERSEQTVIPNVDVRLTLTLQKAAPQPAAAKAEPKPPATPSSAPSSKGFRRFD